MTLLARLWDRWFGGQPAKKPARGDRRPVRLAKFDAAQTGPENREHWKNADDLSANAAADPETRRVLRRRSRYERDNDPHISGLTEELADDLIGTGPRLQLNLGPEHEAACREVEKSFRVWCKVSGFAGKLRVLTEAPPTDGESFGLLTTNPALPHPVKLDLRLFETDQCETPGLEFGLKVNAVSGIEYDADGNPAFYHLLKQHPGDTGVWNWTGGYDSVPARFVLHWYRPRRPGQARGLPKLGPALPVSSQARRFAYATLGSAEYAASVNAVLMSDAAPPDPDDPTEGTPDKESTDWAETRHNRGTILMTPGGTRIEQLEAKHPQGVYGEFMDRQHGTIGRAVRAPLNKVTGSSADFNFASGRLDGLPYQAKVWIERDDLEYRVLDRVLQAWYAEARLVGLIPDSLPAFNEWAGGWEWYYDGFEQLDPLKETQAVELKLKLHLTTLSEACAERGRNWREVLEQRAVELAFVAELEERYRVKLAAAEPAMPTAPNQPSAEPDDDEVPADA